MNDRFEGALSRLDDYLRRNDSEADAQLYEEELFARALNGQAPELSFRAGIDKTLRGMSAHGTLDMWLTRAQAERVMASKARVIFFELDLKNPSTAALPEDFDILLTRVPIDLRGVRQLDVEVSTPTGELLKQMPDIEFDPADQAVYMCCEADLARAAASVKTVTRVFATDDTGRHLLTTLSS